MNLKYKELAEQAWNSVRDEMGDVYREDGLNWDFLHAYDKRYAESIVRQCAEICLEANDHKNILRYFGVQE